MTASAPQGLLLIPSNIQRLDSDKQEMLARFYAPDLPRPTTAVQEMQLWKMRWSHIHGNTGTKSHTPSTLTEALGACNAILYPNINRIFRLLLIAPVTSASVERSTSALNSLQTVYHSPITEERLNALLLVYVQKDIELDYRAIVDAYARLEPRRMSFINPMQ